MATFSIHSLFGVDMLGVGFRKLVPSFLNSSRTDVSADAVSYYIDLYGDGDDGKSVDYAGSFSYTYGEDGSILDAEGRVTSYEVFEWHALSVSFESEWTGFSLSGIDVDLSVLEGTSPAVLFPGIFAGDDIITGDSGADDLYGFAGNDRIDGWGGGDRMDGGAGADTMDGGNHGDTYVVDNAGDMVIEHGNSSGGTDTVESTVGFQLPDFVEHLVLSGGARFGYGNGLANRLTGSDGGNLLKGGAGTDSVDGGEGVDRLYGNRDADTLTGGGGADTFFYKSVIDSSGSATDRITDFAQGTDIIHLGGIDARPDVVGNQQFTFIGTAAFSASNATGQLRFAYDSATDTGTLYGSTDADAQAEFVVKLQGVSALAAADLVL